MSIIAPKNYHITEKIYESHRSIIYQGYRQADNLPVIIKTLNQDYPPPENIAQFRREYELLQTLSLPGVVKPHTFEVFEHHWFIILEDFGGFALNRLNLAGQIDFARFLDLAIQITDILGQIHQQRVIHKDINPANIAMNPQTNQIKILDFGISTTLSRENPSIRNPNVLEGTLLYISPEQTGRMNRAMDYRTDFYSLGATFYELLTGQTPFESDDLMELVHSHIAKQPVPPHRLKESIPPILSDIVLKLMAKNAEDRYQSAHGLKQDLIQVQQQLPEIDTHRFELGQFDISPYFQISQKLYGREAEIEQLFTTFEAISRGQTQIMLIKGYPGIGKSALVNEIQKPLVKERGFFIQGKFEQLKRNTPYASLIQAFQDLIRQLLTESEAQITHWKEKILNQVGANSEIISDVIPELELIIGKQSSAPNLSPAEAQNRFNLVFRNFVRVFAAKGHPLVIFLDDLQWADSASLKLLHTLLTSPETAYLFLIGAYRDNEVDAAHPLLLTLSDIQKTGIMLKEVALTPLDQQNLNQLVADTLKCDLASATPLAKLVFEKTNGNPFFVNLFLNTLYQEGILTFVLPSPAEPNGGWQWDMVDVSRLEITDNVVDLMTRKIQTLTLETQEILKLAACVGNQFDLQTLAVIYEQLTKNTITDLWPAIEEGLILPITNVYGGMDTGIVQKIDENLLKAIIYKFLHDRVQEAAYKLIEPLERKAIDLKIGRLLLEKAHPENQDENLFDILNHLNLALDLITNPVERLGLAELNLLVGRKAKDAIAYEPALQYFKYGLQCLPVNAWQTNYKLAFDLHLEQIECEYLNSNLDGADKLVDHLLNKTQTVLDEAQIYEKRILFYANVGRYQKAIDLAQLALQKLGVNFPTNAIKVKLGVATEILKAKRLLWRKKPDYLFTLPDLDDPVGLAIFRIHINLVSPTYFSNQELFLLNALKMATYSLEHGNTRYSAVGYMYYSMVLGVALNDWRGAYQWAEAALSLNERFNNMAVKGNLYLVFGAAISHWTIPLSKSTQILRDAYQYALEVGDFFFGGMVVINIYANKFISGEPLNEVYEAGLKYKLFMDTIDDANTRAHFNWTLFSVETLLNIPNEKRCMDYTRFNPERFLRINQAKNHPLNLFCYYENQMRYYYLLDNFEKAYEMGEAAKKYLLLVAGSIFLWQYYFWHGLTLAAFYITSPAKKRKKILKNLHQHGKKLKSLTKQNPATFLPYSFLVQAEIARLDHQGHQAIDNYKQALEKAKESNNLYVEALANELAAKFHLTIGEAKTAQTFLQEARYAYLRWGATLKVQDMDEKYPQVFAQLPQDSSLNLMKTTASSSTISQSLDINTIFKASQTLSEEIVLSKLLEKLMQTMLENAGARRGYLILRHDGQWVVEAEGSLREDKIAVLQARPIQTEDDLFLPSGIINYVIRTKENIVLNNAAREGNFTQDPYIIETQPKSLLCTPLLHKGELAGMLYLENNITTGAFTADRLQVLNILSAQAAISIENAKLYQESMKLAGIQRELNLAHDIQTNLLPPPTPHWPDLDVVCYNIPAREVGGDLFVYEAFETDQSNPADSSDAPRKYVLAVGDVSGKGMPAALLMAVSTSSFRAIIKQNLPATDFMAIMDTALSEYTQKRRQNCAMVYAEINLINSPEESPHIVANFVNAGCPAPLLKRADGQIEWVDLGGMPLGVGLGAEVGYQGAERTLTKGDMIILTSDGVVEANNSQDKMFSFEQLEAVVAAGPLTSAEAMLTHIQSAVKAFTGQAEQHDDITIIVIQV